MAAMFRAARISDRLFPIQGCLPHWFPRVFLCPSPSKMAARQRSRTAPSIPQQLLHQKVRGGVRWARLCCRACRGSGGIGCRVRRGATGIRCWIRLGTAGIRWRVRRGGTRECVGWRPAGRGWCSCGSRDHPCNLCAGAQKGILRDVRAQLLLPRWSRHRTVCHDTELQKFSMQNRMKLSRRTISE